MESIPPISCSATDTGTDQAEVSGSQLQDLIKEALQERSLLMFSGKMGRPVASGVKADAATCTTPSFKPGGPQIKPTPHDFHFPGSSTHATHCRDSS